MLDVNMFEQLKIGLATADDIRLWSHGEVKKPETINYRTLRPEKDGLFCEKIFGPTRDWECYCGKYKRVRFKGIICERCGVEVTRSKVRRDRMGHIELSAPVVHIWYLRGTRSWLAYLLAGIEPKEELKAKQLEKVIYFAANLVTWVDEEKRHEDLASLEAEYLAERDEIRKELELAIDRRFKELEQEAEAAESEGADTKKMRRDADKEIESLRERYNVELELIERGVGRVQGPARAQDHRGRDAVARAARQVRRLLRGWHRRRRDQAADRPDRLRRGGDQAPRGDRTRAQLDPQGAVGAAPPEGDQAAQDRRLVQPARRARPPHQRPQGDDPRRRAGDPARAAPDGPARRWPLRDVRPQRPLPPRDQPQQPLEAAARSGRTRDHRQQREAHAPGGRRRAVRQRPPRPPRHRAGNRPLKSLSDMLKGKQGRFRQNLLGKRVDYSGRSVIVAGPTLKLHQCGLPKLMALELFKPFVMKRLVDLELAQNIKTAKRMVERRRPQVWDVLDDVIKEHPVLLNRAPTLHRLGIQAFEPVLVEGKALQIHPLVCTAFNADFDGDQMAIHVPLSAEAQAEARVLMLSANNILSPASGRPIVTPSQDLIIGGYYLTEQVDGAKGEGRVFRHLWEAMRAYDEGALELHAPINLRPPRRRAAHDHASAGRCSRRRCRPTTPSASATSTRRSRSARWA